MIRWEYCEISCEDSGEYLMFYGRSRAIEKVSLKNCMTILGSQGWELVAVRDLPPHEDQIVFSIFYFKRPLAGTE
jgi:hypothetical protein